MGILDSVTNVLSQYVSSAQPTGDPSAHFQQVAESADAGTVASGIAAAMRSQETPPFAQLVSQLFSSGSSDQKMAMLNLLLSSASPEQRAQLSSLIPGADLSSVTGAQAAAVPPKVVQSLAQHVEQHDTGIVDKMSALYAAHPILVKTLGSAAMMVAMRTIAERQQHA
jgi:hypothetical protein